MWGHWQHFLLFDPPTIIGDDCLQLGPELGAAVVDEGLVQVGSGVHDGSLELLLGGEFFASKARLQAPKDGVVQSGRVRAVGWPAVLGEEAWRFLLQQLLGLFPSVCDEAPSCWSHHVLPYICLAQGMMVSMRYSMYVAMVSLS